MKEQPKEIETNPLELEEENKEIQIQAVYTPEERAMITEKYVEAAARQIELRQKLLMTALKALKPHDFQDFDGKPYLEGEGAARIMAVVRGFRVGEARFKIEHIAPHYFIECEIPMEWMGQTTIALGDCSTADAFFTGRDGNSGIYKKYLERTGSDSMAARLVLGDAKKKARENAISRGVSELLGIKGLSWDDLAQFGFKRNEAGSKIEFKKNLQKKQEEIVICQPSEALTTKEKIINIVGILENYETVQVGKDKKEITKYYIQDVIGDTKIIVKKWGKFHSSLQLNQQVICEKVQVSDFKGTKQFLAQNIEPIRKEEENGTSNQNNQGTN